MFSRTLAFLLAVLVAASALLLVALMALITVGKRHAVASCEGTAFVNPVSRTITIDGEITSTNVLQVTIPSLPAGSWTINKTELNLSGGPWLAWEIIFSPETSMSAGSFASADKLPVVDIVPTRNAVVFHGGEVPDGQSLVKTFEISQLSFGSLVMSHNRRNHTVTAAQIQQGLPQELPVTPCTLVVSTSVGGISDLPLGDESSVASEAKPVKDGYIAALIVLAIAALASAGWYARGRWLR